MKFKTESQFTKWITTALERMGSVVFRCVGHEMQEAGWPDRYVAHPIFEGWLEFKKDGGKLRDVQRNIVDRLIRCGVPAFVIRIHHEDLITLENTINKYVETKTVDTLLKSDERDRGAILLNWFAEYIHRVINQHNV